MKYHFPKVTKPFFVIKNDKILKTNKKRLNLKSKYQIKKKRKKI